jgi:hypothetical protein
MVSVPDTSRRRGPEGPYLDGSPCRSCPAGLPACPQRSGYGFVGYPPIARHDVVHVRGRLLAALLVLVASCAAMTIPA